MQNCFELFSRFLNPAFKGFYGSARLGFVALALFGLLGIGGCTSAVDETQRNWANKIFRPYVPDIVQGNFISSEQYAKLQLGMSREQVRQILGTPLLASYFHANRWDYIFEFKREGQIIGKERRVTVFFDGDKVVKFQGDALPTDIEMVAEIDNYAKIKRSFWDVITGSNKAPVTPPLQSPELLVPSPTDNLPKGAAVPPIPAEAKSSFWDFFGSSNKPADGQAVPASETLGPGAMNIPQPTEVKQ
ncbi:outer membrane protein assembly factor BamE [Polynucleobacter sp. MWH-Creno-3A4]|uniref:outer membrane protein assembly factor BamE n=1 Tax=Polynucleobacter sp. MWH-Creno-3A4 TaxID=1855886 RepID=UPI001C0B8B13|nr:outer membrane protein assembly factor BamE [Polynucleobacter sp. MWH-Creno-3A4]MBU3606050.1 outer membrane protein assembly factor BamE [Polynucleobacter sp. MWH-Creno-3A4]